MISTHKWISPGPTVLDRSDRNSSFYGSLCVVAACLLVLAGCAVALRIMLHWTPAGSGVAARQIPLLIEAAAAAVIGVVSPSPFGEPEHATGRWLPLLRLGTATALTAVAFGVLAAAHLDYGYLALLRDLAG